MLDFYFQQGTHDALMKLKGYYYDLVRKQEKAETANITRLARDG